MIVHNIDPDFEHGDIDNLLYRDTDSLPHRTNPNLSVTTLKATTVFGMSTFPSIAQKYVKVHLQSRSAEFGMLIICDLLGRAILSRRIRIDPGENIEYFETSGLASGTYFVRLSESQIGTPPMTKFVVSH
jgi:hypothetical protein